MTREADPAPFIFRGTATNAENVAVAFRVHSYGNEAGNALNLASPTHL